MKTAVIFILFILISGISFAQSDSYYFKSYQINDGLSSNTVTSIIQDKKGFMWFGTRNGLNRFDGTTFKIFKTSLNGSGTIGSNAALSLYEDSDEQLYVGTSKGIYIYDPIKENFKFFVRGPKTAVQKIIGDSQNNIWILSQGKLYKYIKHTSKLITFEFSDKYFSTVHLASDGKIWAVSGTNNIRQFNPNNNSYKTYTIPEKNQKIKDLQINSIQTLGDSALIIAEQTKLVIFNYKTGQLRDALYQDKSIKDIHAFFVFHYKDDEYWVGTEKGLCIYNINTGKIITIQKQYGNPYSIADNLISTIYRDRENGIWLGSYFGGINYYSKYYNGFQKYFPQPGINSISGNIVHEIVKDKYDQLWVGTEDAGLNKIDLKSNHITKYTPDKINNISYNNIHGLCADDDKLWIGTYEHGLDVMDIKTGRVIKHYNSGSGADSFKSNFIVSIYKNLQGEILIGTWTGLFKYNRVKDNFEAIPFFKMQIQTLYQTKDGTLWAGSYGSGIRYNNVFTGKSGSTNQKDGLVNNYVNHIFEDSRHHLWFGTESGLSDYDIAKKQFKNYTSENGLPSDQIFRITEDKNQVLWISTGKGLATYNLKTKKFGAFHIANGLPTEQFNYNSSYQDTDGSIYFGTVKGLIRFNPANLLKNTYVPPVYITGLQVNNRDETISNHSALKKSAIYSSSITLPHDSANLNFNVVALSYASPQMNQYQYKMEGLDKNWIRLRNSQNIYYTNLPPGAYTLKVKGSNNDGVWNDKETKIDIKILPPWWLSKWAYLFYSIIIGGIIITILKYYHQANSEKNKRKIETIQINTERELYNAKIEFFTNVAHEIRTPLTLIKMPLDKLSNNVLSASQIKESINMIKKNTNRLIDLTNQLLDFRKTEANSFSLSFTETHIQEILKDVYTDFKPTAEHKNLSYQLDLPHHPLFAYVDKEALKKILNNLVNNAIKYAVNNVTIRLLPFNSEDSHFNIEFRNDGQPIESKYHSKIFEPFFRIKDTDKEIGTGIGLPLARSLAILHKGDIKVKVSEKGINIFLLSLPLHQETEISFHAKQESGVLKEPEPDEVNLDSTKPVILVVEDNTDILNYIGRELKPKYNIIKACNGQEALHMLDNDNIQLIVSDVMMPVMDGIELCKRVKGDLQLSHIPIILLTAKNSIGAKTEGLEVGADAYIEKPFSFEHLLAQIHSLLNNRKLIKEYFRKSPLTHFNGINISKSNKDFLECLNNHIYEHITDVDLDVDKLSAMMNMSRPTLYRKIKGLSDLSPNELINLTRLKKAAELISNGQYKINEVAFMIGYSSHANFSRDFQRQFGLSPSAYLNKLKTSRIKS
ncbi:hybrid sensor histidine kinase/response regulator [Pedobacter chinensis]|uniref:histidine kinase n=1 Tax=Pedobacter chinensis TaxID=2282421 RepID=A0A369PW37_9SPHI|nr:hybrid sensor histidine kinase/response regulator transcription factor [Pedobacter chinensis]RDC55445.1 hybrid sensor histidine kinase/response regulator [Pedobacter chinensis]